MHISRGDFDDRPHVTIRAFRPLAEDEFPAAVDNMDPNRVRVAVIHMYFRHADLSVSSFFLFYGR